MLKWISLVFLLSVASLVAQTQSGMNGQARADFERADAELHKSLDALLARLPDAESKRKLNASQRAWVAFRDAEAALRS